MEGFPPRLHRYQIRKRCAVVSCKRVPVLIERRVLNSGLAQHGFQLFWVAFIPGGGCSLGVGYYDGIKLRRTEPPVVDVGKVTLRAFERSRGWLLKQLPGHCRQAPLDHVLLRGHLAVGLPRKSCPEGRCRKIV